VVVVDARPAQAFGVEHIAGAINFPHRHMNTAAARDLDPMKTYVIYCDGIGCNASNKGSKKTYRTRVCREGADRWSGMVE
jgi:rhodanese-related sulfurtransferase